MIPSGQAVQLITRFEGFSPKPYRCPADVWTIGYGTTRGVTPATPPITKEEGKLLLLRDLKVFSLGILKLTKPALNQNQFDALCSFVYNVGLGSYQRSQLRMKINRGEFDAASLQFIKWTRGGGRVLPGLVARRQAEAALFRKEL